MATVLTAMGWEKPEGVLQGVWTNRADVVEDLQDGIAIASDVTVKTLAGDDVLEAGTDFNTFSNSGKLYTGSGNDEITASAGDFTALGNNGLIETGSGNDLVRGDAGGYGVIALENTSRGKIFTGSGDDQVIGDSTDSDPGTGISNQGLIDTESGNDLVLGLGGAASGIGNSGKILMGLGNDTLKGVNTTSLDGTGIQNTKTGFIDTGNGNDVIHGETFSSDWPGRGIENAGTIKTGWGNDTIISMNPGDGPSLFNTGFIDMGGGHDVLQDSAELTGIRNEGVIDMGSGDDTFSSGSRGGMLNSGTIRTGDGNDSFQGFAGDGSGIDNRGLIDTGKGQDTVKGISQEHSDETGGIYNTGKIYTGADKDAIEGDCSNGPGIYNAIGGVIDTGSGQDTLTGTNHEDFGDGSIHNAGKILMGRDHDQITGITRGCLINAPQGFIDTGDGNDLIMAMRSEGGPGDIDNQGIIQMGAGNDTLIANQFRHVHNPYYQYFEVPEGKVYLGAGRDFLSGFGRGYFYGGTGWDTLTLGVGEYTVGCQRGFVTFTQDGITMKTAEFEVLKIGGNTYYFTDLHQGDIIG